MFEIQYTRFEDLYDNGVVNDTTFGYRLFDHDSDYQTYHNKFDTFQQLKKTINRKTILTFLRDNHYYCFKEILRDGKLIFNDETIYIDDL